VAGMVAGARKTPAHPDLPRHVSAAVWLQLLMSTRMNSFG